MCPLNIVTRSQTQILYRSDVKTEVILNGSWEWMMKDKKLQVVVYCFLVKTPCGSERGGVSYTFTNSDNIQDGKHMLLMYIGITCFNWNSRRNPKIKEKWSKKSEWVFPSFVFAYPCPSVSAGTILKYLASESLWAIQETLHTNM